MENIIKPHSFGKKLDKIPPLELLVFPLRKLLKIDRIEKIYNEASAFSGLEFVDYALQELNIRYEISPDELENIPKKGTFIAISNHPYGGIDAMLMLSVIAKVRPDFKVLATDLVQSIDNIKDYFLSLDTTSDKTGNLKSDISDVKKLLSLFEQGGSLGIFPAIEISRFQPSAQRIADGVWQDFAAKIIKKSKSPVIPIYFSGYNSILYNLLSLIHPSLSNVKLPAETLNKGDNVIQIRIGKPVPYAQMLNFTDNDQLLRYLRAKSYALGSSLEVKPFFRNPFKIRQEPKKIIDPVPKIKLFEDIEKVRKNGDMVFDFQNFEIFLSESATMPNILREIGRLREITFRAEGEGTNRSIDVDEYDVYYNHLFIWDKDEEQVVGAYRIGKGKNLYERFKIKGFYLNELFEIDERFSPILKQSLEMGRSFIVEAYQRKPFTLFMLWKGLLLYLRKNPEYRYLIGPVSISNRFSYLSKEILVQFIKENYYDEELAKLVKPRKKFKPRLKEESEILLQFNSFKNLKNLDKLISEIEYSHSKIPILLKQYLVQLNAKIIGFNIDPKFNDCLDGFLVMDVQDVPEDTMKMLDKGANIAS